MMKSRIRCFRSQLKHLFLILSVLTLLLTLFSGGLEAFSISRQSVTPRSGTPDDTFLFLVTYSDSKNTPAEYVQLIVGDNEYTLSPVNTDDDNYTDGKDYMVRTKLPKGTHIFYFQASNGTTVETSSASTIQIAEKDEFTHLDVAYSLLLATLILLIPICYGLYLMKKIANNMKKK